MPRPFKTDDVMHDISFHQKCMRKYAEGVRFYQLTDDLKIVQSREFFVVKYRGILAGYFEIEEYEGLKNSVRYAWIHPSYRGLGIAQKSYLWMAQKLGFLTSGTIQTKHSRKLWRNLIATGRNVFIYHLDSDDLIPIYVDRFGEVDYHTDPRHYSEESVYVLCRGKPRWTLK